MTTLFEVQMIPLNFKLNTVNKFSHTILLRNVLHHLGIKFTEDFPSSSMSLFLNFLSRFFTDN